ncbi:GCN5-related N-acetyltransferase [Pacificimonas sp. WHA3]|uniref:GCN5-related N-acetyltransferase n=1 Tax=Pacificimonas pallii TaxID=2827236 RepID=A0ABS6SHK1_9SPHN|nr:GCN5-related N-acetyltransferase [Pacificimonas pallii]MBV7257900.1 GCN5-related N-acetyltransferase [Pacificimonas pallii]
MERAALEREWFELTRDVLPGMAQTRGWPVFRDHCFQRICLDNLFGGVWYDFIRERPAYRALTEAQLHAAVALAREIAACRADLSELNSRSLSWRGKLAR